MYSTHGCWRRPKGREGCRPTSGDIHAAENRETRGARERRGTDRCRVSARTGGGTTRQDPPDSARHRRWTSSSHRQLSAGSGHHREQRCIRSRLWRRRRPPARTGRRATSEPAKRIHHSPPLGSQRRLRQSAFARMGVRIARAGGHVGSTAALAHDEALPRDECVGYRSAHRGRGAPSSGSPHSPS